MDLALVISGMALLFVLMAIGEPMARRYRVPEALVLACLGAGAGALVLGLRYHGYRFGLSPDLLTQLDISIPSEVFLSFFLPILLFQVALEIDIRRLIEDWATVLVMAILAVLLATLSVGLGLFLCSDMSLAASLLLGAVISTTDPSAVVSVFRMTPAPKRLVRIVEGESLLNDAAAIALFGLFVGMVAEDGSAPSALGALSRFPLLILGGGAVGWVMARLTLLMLLPIRGHVMAQVSMTIALPILASIVAEHLAHVSGVTAVVTAGITMSLLCPIRLDPKAMSMIRSTWKLAAHWAGALIFLVAALNIPRLMAGLQAHDLLTILGIAFMALASRAVILFVIQPLAARLEHTKPIEARARGVMLWGGLRGAVTLALALSVTQTTWVPPSVKDNIGILATGYVLFTLLVQGATLRFLISWLGLDRLGPIDLALSRQAMAVALQDLREDMSENLRDHGLSREVIRAEAKRLGIEVEAAIRTAEISERVPAKRRIKLGLLSLAQYEQDLLRQEIERSGVGARISTELLRSADLLTERIRSGGRAGYLCTKALGTDDRAEGFLLFLHNRFGLHAPLAARIADRFEAAILRRFVLHGLHAHIDRKILRLHGRRVGTILHELVARRERDIERTFLALKAQYPHCAEEMEKRFIRRIELARREETYANLHADGLIQDEVLQELRSRISQKRRALERRPRLDMARHRRELIEAIPAIRTLPQTEQDHVERLLRPLRIRPGMVLQRRQDPQTRVWMIATGSVALHGPKGEKILGSGEMFGHLRLFSETRYSLEAIALSHGTVFTLNAADFRRIATYMKSS